MTVDYVHLADRVERGPMLEAAEVRDLVAHLQARFAGLELDAAALGATDRVLHLTDRVAPGVDIHLRGTAAEPNGHWICTIRRNDHSDNDAFIADGRAPTPAPALLIATLRLLDYLDRRPA